ncbi:MAG: hypothetical protein ACI4DU_03630 [Lachnospiraceae bacterium]
MKKKLFRMLLIGLMSMLLVACGQDDRRSHSDRDQEEVVEEENDVEENDEEETEEKKEVEEANEKEANTVEVSEEEPEVITKEYALHGLYGTFHDGVAWAYVIDEEETKKWVLVNTDMQVVYEAPEEAKSIVAIKDDFVANGRSVLLTGQGFMVIGTDGTVLYEYQDEMQKDTLCVAEDGNILFQKHISNMTQDAYFLCVLDEQFQTVTEIEIGERHTFDSPYYGEYDEQYCGGYIEKITDGLYLVANCDNYKFWVNYIVDVRNDVYLTGGNVSWFRNSNGNIGLLVMTRNEQIIVEDAVSLDYANIMAEGKTLNDSITDSGIHNPISEMGSLYAEVRELFVFEGFYDNESYGVDTRIDRMIHPYELVLPDFGVPVTRLIPSRNGDYTGIQLRGVDNNFYYTVIDSSGQQLYEPLEPLHVEIESGIIVDGYIFIPGYGEGITRDGQTFTIGDGTDLSGITEDYAYIMRVYNGYGGLFISEGYISTITERSDCTAVYRLDGTAVTTVTAVE